MLKLISIALSSALLAGVVAHAPVDGARADIRPPPLNPSKPKVPAEAKAWFSSAREAMKAQDIERAAELCDPRGFSDNLVGGSGNDLASLFAQGGRKGWHLEPSYGLAKRLPGDKALIVMARIRANADDSVLDTVHLLLVLAAVDGGEERWLALGAGEERPEVQALAERYLAKAPLAPAEDKRREPEPGQ
jgi:hypothetical protein